MKKLFTLALAVCVALAMFGCAKDGEKTNTDNYAANNTEYVIGCTGPLTGEASSYGISVQEGAMLAINKINEAGGLNGVNFKLDMKDDKAEPADTTAGYDMLYENGMQIAIGSVTSGSCVSFATKAAQDSLFFITPSSSAPDAIQGRNAFRVCFGDPDQGILAAREIVENFEKIGAIYDTSDPYSTGVYNAFVDEMKNLGKDFITQTFDNENAKDFSTQVEALKDCDVIFLPIYYTEAGLIAKAAVAKGNDALLFGCDGFDGIVGQLDDTVVNDIKYITPFDLNSEDPDTKAFVEAYRAAYHKDPDQFAADGFDAINIIYTLMKNAGVNDVTISPQDLCELAIAEILDPEFKYKGVTGEMTWEESGACNKVPVIVDLSK